MSFMAVSVFNIPHTQLTESDIFYLPILGGLRPCIPRRPRHLRKGASQWPLRTHQLLNRQLPHRCPLLMYVLAHDSPYILPRPPLPIPCGFTPPKTSEPHPSPLFAPQPPTNPTFPLPQSFSPSSSPSSPTGSPPSKPRPPPSSPGSSTSSSTSSQPNPLSSSSPPSSPTSSSPSRSPPSPTASGCPSAASSSRPPSSTCSTNTSSVISITRPMSSKA